MCKLLWTRYELSNGFDIIHVHEKLANSYPGQPWDQSTPCQQWDQWDPRRHPSLYRFGHLSSPRIQGILRALHWIQDLGAHCYHLMSQTCDWPMEMWSELGRRFWHKIKLVTYTIMWRKDCDIQGWDVGIPWMSFWDPEQHENLTPSLEAHTRGLAQVSTGSSSQKVLHLRVTIGGYHWSQTVQW